MHLSMCCPTPPGPPGSGRGYMGDLTIPQVKFPQVGEDSVFKSPSQQGGFKPQAVACIKTGYKSSLYYAKPGQIPQYGAKMSGQIESNPLVCPGGGGGGGVVGQHIDRCIIMNKNSGRSLLGAYNRYRLYKAFPLTSILSCIHPFLSYSTATSMHCTALYCTRLTPAGRFTVSR